MKKKIISTAVIVMGFSSAGFAGEQATPNEILTKAVVKLIKNQKAMQYDINQIKTAVNTNSDLDLREKVDKLALSLAKIKARRAQLRGLKTPELDKKINGYIKGNQ